MKTLHTSLLILLIILFFSLFNLSAQSPATQAPSLEEQIKRNLVGRTILEPTRTFYREKFEIKTIKNIVSVEITKKEKNDKERVYHCHLKLQDNVNVYNADVKITYSWNGKAWVFQFLQSKKLDIVATGKFKNCIVAKEEIAAITYGVFFYNNCNIMLIVEGKQYNSNLREWEYYAIEVPANSNTLFCYVTDTDYTIERIERP